MASNPSHPLSDPDRRAHALGQGALMAAGAGALLLAARAVGVPGVACPFRSLTGIPCPGCGFTRLAATLTEGQIGAALRADGAGVAMLGLLAVVAAVHLVRVVVQRRQPARWLRPMAIPVILVALVAVHWATTIATGGLPPG